VAGSAGIQPLANVARGLFRDCTDVDRLKENRKSGQF